MGSINIPNVKNGSVWLVAHPDETNSDLIFHSLETGKLLIDSKSGSHHCGVDAFLLLYSCSGEGELDYDGQTYHLPELTIMLIDCTKSYKLKTAPGYNGVWSCYWLRFNGSGCRFFYDTINSDEHMVFSADPPEIKDEFDIIRDDFFRPGLDTAFKICHSIATLLTYMVELKMSQMPKHFRHQQTIGDATQYIRDNYNTPIDIDQLAKQANLSKYYFIKLFKEFMHVTPYEYVINHRINEAKKYLRVTQRKVSQISDSVGFNDECNFIRTFKRVTGYTPLQYRDRERR